MSTAKLAQACVYCNRKKIKCGFSSGASSCQTCYNLGIECIRRSRKRPRRATDKHPRDGPEAGHSREQSYFASESLQTVTLPGASLYVPQNAPSPRYLSAPNSQHTSPPIHQEPPRYHPIVTPSLGPTNHSQSSHSGSMGERINNKGSATYIGRSHYLSHDTPIDEDSSRAYAPYQPEDPSGVGNFVLQKFNAFELPLKSTQQALMDSFVQFCYPWTPILNSGELDFSTENKPSLLLSQALFMAASRVSSSAGILAFASPAQFYERAKALFFMNHETDPLSVIKATIMLQWYTPDGPEHVSYDVSEFWLRLGVGIAYQLGLHKDPGIGKDASTRRRVWWSLVVRDALMSVAHGRPRAINSEDVSVRPLVKSDFEDSLAGGADLFIYYASICCILGDITEACSRNTLSQAKQDHFRSLLFRWPRTLPLDLHVSYQNPGSNEYLLCSYDIRTRQLHIPYFIAIAIVGRPSAGGIISPQSILAASFVAGIFEELLVRDDISRLAPIFNRYCVAASFFLISLRPFSELWEACQPDLEILRLSLGELSKRWKSAIGGSKALESILSSRQHNATPSTARISCLTREQHFFFDGFPLELCRMWKPYMQFCGNAAGERELGMPLETDPLSQDLVIPAQFNLMRDNGTVSDMHFPETGLPDFALSDFLWEGLENWVGGK